VPRIGAVEYPDVIDLGMPQYRLSDKDRYATRLVRDQPAGIPGSELDEVQQANLLLIVDRFLERHPRPVAEKLQKEVRDGAWTRSTSPGRATPDRRPRTTSASTLNGSSSSWSTPSPAATTSTR
jgi:hypothetical protein